MKTKEAIDLFQFYQKSTLRQRTLQSYTPLLGNFGSRYGERSLKSIGSEEVFHFLETVTEGRARSTRRLRYVQLKAFYNFIINRCDSEMRNPCSAPLLAKAFKGTRPFSRKIPEKEMIDELIYNTQNLRDRLILELKARCGLRIGESLNIRVSDVTERKILLREPKSGKEAEVAYMPEPVAKRIADYIREANLSAEDRLFPICYSTARAMIRTLGARLKMKITPHDLRRYSATYASRNGVPLEIVSKVILRHQDLKTTQSYLGKVSEAEAIRWMDILHGR
ncbi:MAG TPA: site-specific integrase [Syntrophales bacterium]|nr:site-specific integrase [Syntrophales bacterium]HPI57269.1 site-specific integrase [Syntrophales bacterium]HPN25149.1 site-specific integrase [Syntrophales bacterium]HQM29431.1 site-specific integrase [Syntrophales bacterium]HQO63549.1 site-specific integrase [Syntrophorhabdus sp.]